MTRTPLRCGAAAISALLLSATLAACGDDDTKTAPQTPETTTASPTDTPETAEPTESETSPGTTTDGRISGQGYEFAIPDGWHDGTEQMGSMSPMLDTAAIATDASAQFADNLNVLRNPDYPEMAPAEAEEQFADEARTVSKRVRVHDQVDLDGLTAVHISGYTPIGQTEARSEQYAVYADDAWYVLTFSLGPDTADEEAQSVMDGVLDSWRWS